MSTTIVSILALLSIFLWIMVSRELMGNSTTNTGKMVTLIFAGSLSTIFLIISLYQKL